MKAPVALLFLKADLVNERLEDLKGRLPRLVTWCQNHCQYFSAFDVSSIGHIGPNGQPPPKLMPRNVVKPLIWILEHV
jgi:hypothetical protein